MNQLKIVNYKSAKAYYTVESNSHAYVATLKKYMGDAQHRPPRKVTFMKSFAATAQKPHTSASLLEDVSRAIARR